MSLTRQTISGIKWTSVASIITTVVQLLQIVILAHYLNPTDFGLMSIVMVVIGFSQLFIDMGMSGSIIHEKRISHLQLSSLYWLNICSGITVFLMVFSLAPFIANFYKEFQLTPLIQLLSLTFIASSFGNQYEILFQKELKFNVLAKVRIVSTLLSFCVAVSCAVYGYGVYSLVYASLFSSVASSLLYVVLGIRTHKPSFIFQYNEIKKMVSFGAYRLGGMILNYFNSQFDVILIGKLLGSESLGIYSIAKNLSMRPANVINPIVTKVTFPVMAQIQDDILKLKEIYLKTINYLSSINFPIYILIAILAEPITLILFGEKWSDSILILQILSIYRAIRSTTNPIGSLQLARGRTDLGFYWNLALFMFIPLTIFFGSNWELYGIAYSLLFLNTLLLIPNWYFRVKPLCAAGFSEYFRQIFKPLIISIIGGITGYGVNFFLNIQNIFWDVVVISGVMWIVVLALNILLNRNFVTIFLKLLR